MNRFKEEIMQHQLDSIEFVKSLKNLSEELWRTPIDEGKWTVAEVVGHFKPWDEFVLHKRLPYLFSAGELPKGPDSVKTNAHSAKISRAAGKHETIREFVTVREDLYHAMREIPDEDWEKKFSIGKTTLSLHKYLSGLAEHDLHHFKQIKRIFN